jgi:transcription initiation factor IIE alpha subunit
MSEEQIKQKAEELLALMLKTESVYYSLCLSNKHINISLTNCDCENYIEGIFLCPECGEQINKNSETIIRDFEFDNFQNRKLLSEGFVYRCKRSKRKIVVLINV